MMHAERIIDALGFQLFQLSSRQKKHVEEVRKSGRWAPNPEDPLKPPNTPSPPPLQLVAGNSVRQKSSRLKLDHIEFTMVKRGSFVRPFLHAIASEYFYDGRSEERVRSFFSQQKAPFKNYIRVTQLGEAADGQPSFVAQLRLPIDKRYGDRICMGKGSNPKEAVHLACMHAELTIDALGLALFPNSKAKQSAHVAECRRVGRWCVLPGEQCEDRFNTPSPPPLALEEGSSSAHSGRQAQHSAVMTSESKIDCSMDNTLLMHSVAVKAIHCVHDVPTIDRLAYYHLERYLNREEIKDILSVEVTDWKEMFFVETLGMKGHHETHRGTVTVPLLTGDGGGDCFVAIGIAGTMDDAVLAASMHAMQLLHLLGRYTTGVVNDTSQWKALKSVPDVDYPPPVRCVPNTHLCRVSFAGITALSRRREYTVKMQTDDSHLSRRASLKTRQQGDPLKMDMKVKEIMKAREKVSPLDWSTEADVESRIVVSPTVTVAESYGHTLTSARRPDRLCVNRLQDYLERHGKRLRMSLETSSEQVGGNVLEAQRQVFYTTKVVLPIPVKYPMNVGGKATSGVTRLVACGEGYTAADSIQMCAMHAELLLDTLGYCFYDHVLLQERHADTCMLLGRWAPSHLGELTPAAFHIPPPPIRKECNQSTAWSAVENKYSRVTPKAAGEPQPLDGATTEPNSEASEEELFNLDKMKFIHPKELFRDAQKHMEFYCRNRGVEYHQTLKQYSFSDPSRGMVHRCQVQVPVPAQYGKRIAVGCAATKRLSFLLCAMHATQILDALHIPIYFGQQQVKYATLARRKGVSSPVRGQLAAGPSTPSPPGLYCFEETQEMVGIPVAPVFEDLVKSTAIWETYIAECKRYLNRKADAEVVKAVLQERRCPRTGIEEVDIGLEAVEQAPLNPSARVHLEELCKRHGLPPPPYFRYEPYGRGDEKVYYGSAAVKGTPYEARGRAKSGHDCVLRMAMHYEYIVKQIVIPNSGKPAVAIRTGPQSGRRPSKTHTCLNEFYDVERAVLTDKGKLIAMAIYTQTNKPFLPLQVRFKPGTKGARSFVLHKYETAPIP
ncbi:hypothetical protein AGDE_08723 [Angomonas deanei]|uniref:REH2 DRSM domain-containing protein n=1 Tax=Angomonas deanei TaxID=59799 RepID=A0A7G2CHK8_9TRYP|nr:hypothetical protein AGDE_08723 [Angomonas deanei]CAD2218547.1 hypothetical protein, conserved [Angomonas deanei]|eukprot:EPY32377.1 hypothetical protein AGDE_08723 [Angomonas deanei]